jgi:tellurite resistance protein TehA-like permease
MQKALPAMLAPTSWIVLGPLGQSVTAAGGLGKVAPLTLHAPYAAGAGVFALLYGVPAWGFAMAWLVIATVLAGGCSCRRARFPDEAGATVRSI